VENTEAEIKSMAPSARITVTKGPDRGSLLEMSEEVVQIGAGDGNALILHDPLLEKLQISVMRRGGRHAIFVAGTDEVEVAGTRIPPDQWIWLPQTASIQVTRRTKIEFTSLVEVSEADYEATSDRPTFVAPNATAAAVRGGADSRLTQVPKQPAGNASASGTKADTKSGGKSKPAVARFITGQAGDPVVKLGADGQLPDLELSEGDAVVPQKKPRDEQANSLMLIVMFAVSVGISMAMLLLDFESPTGSVQQVQVARRAIGIFYGDDQVPLEPYQKLLRRASWTHSQGDFNGEKAIYRQILLMLRSENQSSTTGLTHLPLDVQKKFDELSLKDLKTLGGPHLDFTEIRRNDDRLARLLSILLSDS
jgi:hypothetical protein